VLVEEGAEDFVLSRPFRIFTKRLLHVPIDGCRGRHTASTAFKAKTAGDNRLAGNMMQEPDPYGLNG
jgi:hypothetical protein